MKKIILFGLLLLLIITPSKLTHAEQIRYTGPGTSYYDARYVNLDSESTNITNGTFDLTTTGIGSFGGVAIPTIQTATTEPTGFVNRTATLSFVNGTRVLTITGAHDIYINGVKTSKTTDSITLADSTGQHWVYYNAAGTLSQSLSHPGFELPTMAIIYYNTDGGFNKGLVQEERHGIKMDGDTHQWAHDTIGVRWTSGLTGTFVDDTFGTTSGAIDDEDINFPIGSETTCDVLYKDGAADFVWLENQTKYYYEDGGSDINYNDGNTLTAAGGNKYVAYWIFATTSITKPIISLMGQRVDDTLAQARTNNRYESLALGTLPFEEMKLLYRVILRNDATPYEEVQDLRSVSNLPSGTYIATDHGVLSGLTDDDHLQYLLIDGTRAMTGTLSGTAIDMSGNVEGATVTIGGAKVEIGYERGVVVEDLKAADDNVSLGFFAKSVTITGVACSYIGTGATPATITLEDGSGNAMTITGTNPTCVAHGTNASFANVTANNSLVSGEIVRFDTTAVAPETDSYTIMLKYTID